jgi:hypothetical protein
MPVMRRNNAQNVIGAIMDRVLANFKWQISKVVEAAERAGYFSNWEELTRGHRRFVDEIRKGEQADVNWARALHIHIDRDCTPIDPQTCHGVG